MFAKRNVLPFLTALTLLFFAPSATQSRTANAESKKKSKRTDAAAAKQFMWKVTSGTSVLYLVGSIHMVPPEFYPLPAAMEKQFADSSILVLEIDESKADPMLTQQYAVKAGLYANGDSITDHISKKTAEEFKKYTAGLDAPVAASFLKMKPWFASIMIPMVELQKRGFDPKQGIDKHFLDEAHKQGKSVEELETTEFQLNLLSGFPDEMQDKLLMSSLVDAANTDRDAKEMVAAWKGGDAALMDNVVGRDEREHPELKPAMEKLLYERNGTMLEKIERYLKSGKKYFVVVGAGHVVGDRGLVKMLQDKHYNVAQM